MEKSRFQITIRGLLWATFWVAVSAGAWLTKVPEVRDGRFFLPDFILMGRMLLLVYCPFTAIGALFGMAFRGFLGGNILTAIAICMSAPILAATEYRNYPGGLFMAVGFLGVELVIVLVLCFLRAIRRSTCTQM